MGPDAAGQLFTYGPLGIAVAALSAAVVSLWRSLAAVQELRVSDAKEYGKTLQDQTKLLAEALTRSAAFSENAEEALTEVTKLLQTSPDDTAGRKATPKRP